MGQYINVTPNGNSLDAKGKVKQILEEFNGSREVEKPSSLSELSEKDGLICVAENGLFDAAAYVYSDNELADFSLPDDNRKKTWIIADKDMIEMCCNW